MGLAFADEKWISFFNNEIWKHLIAIGEQGEVSVFEKILRPLLVYAGLVFLFRFFGKRELAQLNPIDLVVLLLVSNTVQNAIIGNETSLTGGIIGVVALLGINNLVARIKFKSAAFETFVEGAPRTLIENGKINQKVVEREMLTKEDLDVIAHDEGFENADEVEKCVLDPNGSFLVEGKSTTKDEKFKKDVLQKLEELTKQISALQAKL